MKRMILTASMLLTGASLCVEAYGETKISEELELLKKAALLERQAVREKNQYAIIDAIETYGKLSIDPLIAKTVEETVTGALGEPVWQFNEKYCEYLLDTDFEVVKLKDLSAMRGFPTIMGRSYSLAPGSSATVMLEGMGECEILVVTEDNSTMNVSVSSDSGAFPVETEEEGTVSWSVISLPQDEIVPVNIKFENPSDKNVSFVIGIK
ncbi:MAG: hypothetical protein HDS95_05840 [Bacteroidales bacterium]|nr:hypothetical protein [Bacteroidales bacterium]MBD5287794.1 hypothetical protein [Bacteroides sp.]